MNYNNNPEKQLLLMQPPILQGVATPVQQLPTHDWGIFGEYEYLGAGTPYVLKRETGVKPRNDLDKIAMYHDSQYEWSKQHNQVLQNVERSVFDIGAGAAMVSQNTNFSILAGVALISQGLIRVTPIGQLLDLLFY
jgi:hypothetical protein